MTSFGRQILDHAATVCRLLDAGQIDRVAAASAEVRDDGGRLVLGVGGSAGQAFTRSATRW